MCTVYYTVFRYVCYTYMRNKLIWVMKLSADEHLVFMFESKKRKNSFVFAHTKENLLFVYGISN